ncbi:uncharacterized protein LOC115687490 [Syzygium oleosum]|uniref:uncharacterized protein LOC115687490 n=1 Tax=Syzygium oleosum TaxID=219896 RepID=UPI0011D21C4F|nr:uncharacterized protein LOC115687490 [Syzygium oleosum]
MALAKPCTSTGDPWNARSSMMTWASSILLAIIFLIVLGVSTIWLTVRPRQLQFAVKDALVSNFSRNHSRLVTADFNIKMSANNSNHRVSFSYDTMKVSVKSYDKTLASADGPHLINGRDSFTNFQVNLSSHNVELLGSTWSDWVEQNRSGEIKIDVIIDARVKFKALHWKQDRCKIRIFCGDVAAHFLPKESFQYTECDVEL